MCIHEYFQLGGLSSFGMSFIGGFTVVVVCVPFQHSCSSVVCSRVKKIQEKMHANLLPAS